MSLCPACGLHRLETELCPRHVYFHDEDWAVANRIMCDFFHRRVEPPRLVAAERAGAWEPSETESVP
jgi:hypothetical protein